jgi:uncharacterized membrane protein
MRSLPRQFQPLKPRWNILEKAAFDAFLFWTAAGLIFTLGHISTATVAQWHLSPLLQRFVDFCLHTGDPILILLAVINTHLHTVRQWSTGVSRRWALLVLVFAFCVETFGVSTGFPFGSYTYTGRFGPMLGVIPLTIPFAWLVVVTNALFLVRALAPHLGRIAEAALVGVICTTYDFILEPFATTVKGYWIWTEGSVPPLNYIAWFVLSALLVRLLAPTLSMRYRWDIRPAAILGLTVMIFLAGRF